MLTDGETSELKTLSAAAALVGSAMAAHAADLSSRPAYDWSGFYAGVFGSYTSGTADGEVIGGGSDSFAIDGLQLGGLAGYNMELNRLVFGVEADAGLRAVDGVGFGGGIDDFDVTPMAHLRGRIGLPLDRLLPFIAAGLTLGDGRARSPGNGTPSNPHLGWNIGAGLDLAVSERLVLRAEYIYDRLSTETYSFAPGDIDFGWDSSTLRGALVWKF